ncbi:M50 family metallopeptidase [Embleya hyalina]|uniref:Putative zinc metalloprotease n=1 Tax=Embleya hyalina TaxID=516124 RepID=A0A401YP81_9ACTN|nr:site-2 protease family protein [Embleya hyalina]GCD96396.1 putative zinc metalloprotease [Embleya hyalina]
MTLFMTILGIVVFVVGLLFSIAWHEAGHLVTGKMFGVRVPQYMVGFGRTLWSKKIGETEYGLKAIPAGGYCRLIGMFPPDASGKVQARSTSPWRSMIEDAREASYEEVGPGDEDRMFYQRKPWQRTIIMLAGPFMNLILAIGLLAVYLMGFGINKTTSTVSTVSECVVSADAKTDKCPPGAKPAPGKAAGLLPGDRIVAFNGQKIGDYEKLQGLIRKSSGEVTLVVDRKGQKITLKPVLEQNTMIKIDGDGRAVPGQYVTTGFLGISPATGIQRQSAAESVEFTGDIVKNAFHGLLRIPQKVPALWGAAFQGDERDQDSPVGVVGAARVGGEVAALDVPPSQRVGLMIFIIAGFNVSLFLFNMLPLLPLDGGHVVGAWWESIRRRIASLRKRPDPGPFDVARLMPVAYVVASIFIAFTVLVLIADLINPVKVT